MFFISRIEQYKFSDCAAVYAEAERTLTRYDNPDWHPERVGDNVHLVSPSFDSGIEKYILDLKKEYKCRLSIDSTLPKEKQTNCYCQAYFGASPEFFETLSKEQCDEYFKHCLNFFTSSFPDSVQVLSAVVHYDETTPHMHISFLPLIRKENSRGKMKTVFSSTELFKGKDYFIKYQDNFYAYMKEFYPDFDFQRKGEIKQDHLSIREFKSVQRDIENAKEELEEVKQLKNEVIESGGKLLDLKIANARLKEEKQIIERDLLYYKKFFAWLEQKFPKMKPVFDFFHSDRRKRGIERD